MTAEEVRARNADLDAGLVRLAGQITPANLHVAPADGEWTPAEILAHLAEFPRFFAADLARQLDAEGVEVGRTHEHPDRNQAIASATGRDLDDLLTSLSSALGELARTLEQLEDGHLERVGHNRKYGPEPLATFLDRYVLGHKAGHVDQLQRALSATPAQRHSQHSVQKPGEAGHASSHTFPKTASVPHRKGQPGR
jgi:hypothetical protein